MAYRTPEAQAMADEIAADRAKPRAKQNDGPKAPAQMNAGEAPTKHELGSSAAGSFGDAIINTKSLYRKRQAANEAAAKEAEKYLR